MNRFYRSTGSHLVGVAGFVRSEATEQRSLRRGSEPIASRIRRGRHGGKARAGRKRRLGFERAEGQQKAQASQEGGLGQMVGRMRPQLNTKQRTLQIRKIFCEDK